MKLLFPLLFVISATLVGCGNGQRAPEDKAAVYSKTVPGPSLPWSAGLPKTGMERTGTEPPTKDLRVPFVYSIEWSNQPNIHGLPWKTGLETWTNGRWVQVFIAPYTQFCSVTFTDASPSSRFYRVFNTDISQ